MKTAPKKTREQRPCSKSPPDFFFQLIWGVPLDGEILLERNQSRNSADPWWSQNVSLVAENSGISQGIQPGPEDPGDLSAAAEKVFFFFVAEGDLWGIWLDPSPARIILGTKTTRDSAGIKHPQHLEKGKGARDGTWAGNLGKKSLFCYFLVRPGTADWAFLC